MRAQLTKRINEVDIELNKANIDKNALRVKLDMIIKCFEKINELDQQILAFMAEKAVPDAEQDNEFSTIAKYEEKFRLTK